jgi:hypothetical protein
MLFSQKGGKMTSLFNDPRLPQRFWDKITHEPNSGCWLWTAGCDHKGYGNIRYQCKMRKTHKLIYEILVYQVPILNGMEIHHTCEVKSCCNPIHLEILTPKQHYIKHQDEVIERASRILGTNLEYRKFLKLGRLPGIMAGEVNGASKLTGKDVFEIRQISNIYNRVETAKMYGVSPSRISEIVNNKAWNTGIYRNEKCQ